MEDTWKEIDAFLKAKGVRIGPPVAVQTVGGKHAAHSYHYLGTARDYGIYDSDARAVALALKPEATKTGTVIAELFFAPLDIWYKHGTAIPGWRIGGHQDHCHVALEVGKHLSAHPGRSTPPLPIAGSSHPTLHVGATGPEVKVLQNKLIHAGYPLVADGVFGPKTLHAVRSFQISKGLQADGVVGPKTWAALG